MLTIIFDDMSLECRKMMPWPSALESSFSEEDASHFPELSAVAAGSATSLTMLRYRVFR